MAFNLFLNFEKLSINVIENELRYMTNENLMSFTKSLPGYDQEIDEDALENNLHHGAIAITFIVNLFETALNSILSRQIKYDSEEILKSSYTLKLQLICYRYGIDFAKLKGDHRYRSVKEAIALRNDITHFKSNDMGVGSALFVHSSFAYATSKRPIEQLFTRDVMQTFFDAVMHFLEYLCNECNLMTNKDCLVIDSDGRSELCEYILPKSIGLKTLEE